MSWLQEACLCTCTQDSTKLNPHGAWQKQNLSCSISHAFGKSSHYSVFPNLGKKYAGLSGLKWFKICLDLNVAFTTISQIVTWNDFMHQETTRGKR